MPVAIYQITSDGEKNKRIAWLCDDEWTICPQIEALSEWLEQSGAALPAAEYVADVGFKWRRSASAGGAALEPKAMRRMAEIGMSLFLSEYSGFAEEEDADENKEHDA